MAEISNSNQQGLKKGRRKSQSPRMDMTPMVDLAFLLLTFFVLTATFSKPTSTEFTFPAPAGDPPPIKNGITFLLSKDNRIFYYEGEFRSQANQQGDKTLLKELNFSKEGEESLHAYLLTKNETLQTQIKQLDKQYKSHQLNDSVFKNQVMEKQRHKDAYTYLIKTDREASYKNVVDVIDELNVNVVGKYVMAEMMQPELDLLNQQLASK